MLRSFRLAEPRLQVDLVAVQETPVPSARAQSRFHLFGAGVRPSQATRIPANSGLIDLPGQVILLGSFQSKCAFMPGEWCSLTGSVEETEQQFLECVRSLERGQMSSAVDHCHLSARYEFGDFRRAGFEVGHVSFAGRRENRNL